MKYIKRVMAIVTLVVIAPIAHSGSLDDSIEDGDTLTETLLNNAKTAINDNDSRVTALETEDGVINSKVTALETVDGVINGKVTALEAADGDMNVRVSILEGQPKAKVGFGDPSSSTEVVITGSELGTVYIDIVPRDIYMVVAIVSDTAVWKLLTQKEYAIGDVGPAGGWVFYVTDDGLHGLEAAPVDQASVTWGCSGFVLIGADGLGIGTGDHNTSEILAGCSDVGIAAGVADDYISPSGYFDWYLPSKDELNLLYNELHAAGLGGFASNGYWSSTEINDIHAWSQFFSQSGLQTFDSKSFSFGVRAVRAF